MKTWEISLENGSHLKLIIPKQIIYLIIYKIKNSLDGLTADWRLHEERLMNLKRDHLELSNLKQMKDKDSIAPHDLWEISSSLSEKRNNYKKKI
jgi:uncharacterized protein (DUF342 family)